MRAMRDSGVEWIDKIPEGWDVRRIKYLARLDHGSDPSTDGDTPVWGSGSKPFATCGETKYGPTVLLGRKGTLNCPQLVQGPYWNVDTAFDAHVYDPVEDIKYFYYVTTCIDVDSVSTNAVKPSMTQSDWYSFFTPYPTLDEQRRIADYLDACCADIDAISLKVRSEIDMLGEYRKSVIYEAVTKGLDKGVPMRDSGIEWVGEIPEGWGSKPIGVVSRENKQLNEMGLVRNALQFSYGTIVPKQNFDADTDDYVDQTIRKYVIVNPSDIVINGLNLNYDFISQRVGMVRERGVITSAYMVMTPDTRVLDPQFILYLLKSYDGVMAFHNMGSGVRKILNYNILKHVHIPVPPLDEQRRIAGYLDARCADIDAVIARKRRQFDVLADYRKSLVYECVTGKREVC